MSRNVVGDVQMTNNPSKAHVGGASEADVSAADVELAAMNAKPSNVIPGIIIVCLAISLGCSVGASATDEWAVSGYTHYGFFQKCSIHESYDSTVMPLKICYKQKQLVDPADPIKAPYRVRVCQRYGAADSDKPYEVTYKEETGDGWGKPSVTCDIVSPDQAKLIADAPTPTPAPTVEGATSADLGAGYTNKGNSYSGVRMVDSKGEKGDVVKQLITMAVFSQITNGAHLVSLIGAIVVFVISFLHNCCPTGKCPPTLPVIVVLITFSCVVITFGVQLFTVAFWVIFPGKFFGDAGAEWGVSYNLATWSVLLDLVAVFTYGMRIEMRFRTCCAGRDHCCAKV